MLSAPKVCCLVPIAMVPTDSARKCDLLRARASGQTSRHTHSDNGDLDTLIKDVDSITLSAMECHQRQRKHRCFGHALTYSTVRPTERCASASVQLGEESADEGASICVQALHGNLKCVCKSVQQALQRLTQVLSLRWPQAPACMSNMFMSRKTLARQILL